MTGAWPFLGIALLLMAVVILLLRRSIASTHDLTEPSHDDAPASALHAEPFPQQLTDRLFGSEDWNFVRRQGSTRVKRLFLQQRTALALSWLRRARTNAFQLIHAHRAAARKSSQLEPIVELRVAADYVFFQSLCQVSALVIWLRGPVDFSRLIGCVNVLSKRLSEAVTRVFPVEPASEDNKRGAYLPGGRGRG